MGGGLHERIAVLEAEIRMLREQRGWVVGMIEGQKTRASVPGSGEKDKGMGSGDGYGEKVIVVGDDNDDGGSEGDDEVVSEEGKGKGQG